MSIDPNVHPQWAQETKEVAASLEQLDYYQILGAAYEDPIDELKAKYHQLQRNYHPDTFFTSPDADLKDAVMRIAKRVAEAYVVLRDPQKREKYTRDITGPDREKKLRYTEQSDSEARREKEQESGKTAQGRQLWAKVNDWLNRGDLKSAERDLKMAILFEPKNDAFKRKLEEIQQQLKGS